MEKKRKSLFIVNVNEVIGNPKEMLLNYLILKLKNLMKKDNVENLTIAFLGDETNYSSLYFIEKRVLSILEVLGIADITFMENNIGNLDKSRFDNETQFYEVLTGDVLECCKNIQEKDELVSVYYAPNVLKKYISPKSEKNLEEINSKGTKLWKIKTVYFLDNIIDDSIFIEQGEIYVIINFIDRIIKLKNEKEKEEKGPVKKHESLKV